MGCATGEDGQKNEFRPGRTEQVKFGIEPESPGKPPETFTDLPQRRGLCSSLEDERTWERWAGAQAGFGDTPEGELRGWALHLPSICTRWGPVLPTVK